MSEKELAQALYQAGLLTEEQIRAASAQRAPGVGFADIIVRNGWVTPEQIASVGGHVSSTPPSNTPWGSVSPTGQTSGNYTPPPAAGPPPPYSAPPPYAPPPIPAPTGYTSTSAGPAGTMPPSSRSGIVSTDAIGEAWALLKPNMGTWLAAIVVYFVITGIFSGIQQVVLPKQPNGQPQIGPMWGLFTFLGFILGQFLNAGIMRLAIENVRTGRAELGEMFNVGDVLINVLIAAVLTFIVTVLGAAACLIPGIILGLGLSMTNQIIVDQKLDAIAAMTRSWGGMKSRLGALFVLLIVLVLLNFVGVLACCVGVLVTFALTQLTLAVVYRDVFYGTSPVPLENP